MGSLWSSTPLMTVSRLPWMNCAAANSPTKSYWTGRSSWDWGRTSHGESYDSFGDLAGPQTQQPTTATAVVPLASLFAARHVPTSGEQTWPRRRQLFGRRTGSPQAGRSRAAAAAADMGTLVWTRLADRRRKRQID